MTVKIVSVKVKAGSVKSGLSHEFMNDIFRFIEKPYPVRINLQFRLEDPNYKICYRNIEENDMETFSK